MVLYKNQFTILERCKCIQTLHKRTYKGSAFKKNHTYFLVEEDNQFYCVLDEQGHIFNFSKSSEKTIYYIFNEFFKILKD